MTRALILGIRAYQVLVSPLLGPRCRFYPTCSAYAAEALRTHGAARGTWLAARRLLRCHPWHPGGVDFVPPTRRRPDQQAASSGHSAGSASSDGAQQRPEGWIVKAPQADGTLT